MRADGIAGDRLVVVHRPDGVVTVAHAPGLLALHAMLSPTASRSSRTCRRRQTPAAALVQMAAGADAQLALLDTSERFDVLPLLVATDGAIKAFGRDGRRLRPNIVLGGVDGLAERDWEGARLRIGDVVIRLDSLRDALRHDDVHPDTARAGRRRPEGHHARFDGRLALEAAGAAARRDRARRSAGAAAGPAGSCRARERGLLCRACERVRAAQPTAA